MKKLLITLLLGISTLTLSAQYKTLTMVMGHKWNFDVKTNNLISDSKCEDGIEFDFEAGRAHYYTPDEKIYETICRIADVKPYITNQDKSRTYEYQLVEVGSEKKITCILVVSEDLKTIKFTMMSGDKAAIYDVTHMLTDEDN